jgi:hypothetical protein
VSVQNEYLITKAKIVADEMRATRPRVGLTLRLCRHLGDETKLSLSLHRSGVMRRLVVYFANAAINTTETHLHSATPIAMQSRPALIGSQWRLSTSSTKAIQQPSDVSLTPTCANFIATHHPEIAGPVAIFDI